MRRRDFLSAAALGALAAALPASLRAAPAPAVRLGIDNLEAGGFSELRGVRCGLLTHPAGLAGDGRRTADILARAPGVRLAKLFGPEHGFDGAAAADVKVGHGRDARTGLPTYSLYGATRRPTAEMLEGLDVMVVDLQDIGSRSYTYVSCLRYVMEACFKAPRPIRVVVLDRPNPLGGEKINGPGLDPAWRSYVGAHPTPYVHGLTIGEHARWAAGTPGVLELTEAERRRGHLQVIPMHGWRRSMTWFPTGLDWRATSPMIPTPQAAVGYAMTGLGCQLGDFRHGHNRTGMPFRFLSYPRRRGEEIAAALNGKVPGLQLKPSTMEDGTSGVYTEVTDWAACRPCALSPHLLRLACAWGGNPFPRASKSERELFIKHWGREADFEAFRAGGARTDVEGMVARWAPEHAAWRAARAPFLLYRA